MASGTVLLALIIAEGRALAVFFVSELWLRL